MAAVLLVLPVACGAQSRSPQATQTTASSTIEERAFSVPGTSKYERPWIEFATRDRGYALFTSCGPDSWAGEFGAGTNGSRLPTAWATRPANAAMSRV